MRYFIIALIVVAIISGCGNGGNELTPAQVGSKGLEININEKAYKTEIYENEENYISVEISNEGYADIIRGLLVPILEEDLLTMVGYDLPYGVNADIDNSVTFNLKGKTLSVPIGERQVVVARVKAREIDESRNKIMSNVVFDGCYVYRSVLSDTLCIDTDPGDLSIAQKTCQSSKIVSSGQGAPVVITRVEPRIIPDVSGRVGMQIKIFAKNRGDGLILNPNEYQSVCLGETLSRKAFDTIYIKEVSFSDYRFYEDISEGLICEPNPMAQEDGEFYTTCTTEKGIGFDKGSILTMETPLIVDLYYGYEVKKSVEIDILNNHNQN